MSWLIVLVGSTSVHKLISGLLELHQSSCSEINIPFHWNKFERINHIMSWIMECLNQVMCHYQGGIKGNGRFQFVVHVLSQDESYYFPWVWRYRFSCLCSMKLNTITYFLCPRKVLYQLSVTDTGFWKGVGAWISIQLATSLLFSLLQPLTSSCSFASLKL